MGKWILYQSYPTRGGSPVSSGDKIEVACLSLIFLLAHLVSDFLLQTDKIFRWKKRGIVGLIVHAGIFCPVAAVLLFPFLLDVWPFIIILASSHFLIDWMRVSYIKRTGKDTLSLFLLDQTLHIGAILAASYLAISFSMVESCRVEKFYNLTLLILLSGLIFILSAFPILLHYIRSTFTKEQE